MKKLKSKNGITLIALIITIIILLILAMVTINILINQGIIGHANNAVRDYEVAEEKELISLAYQNYKMDKLGNNSAELTVDGADVDWEEAERTWHIDFKKTHHTYSLKENGTIEVEERWTQNENGTISKGNLILKVGDYIDYDHTKDADGNAITKAYTSYALNNASNSKNEGRSSGYSSNQTFTNSDYNGGWQVMSVKNGKLQLISAESVGALYLIGKQGYSDGPDELNAISSIYGDGKGATGARSINVEDINDVTGYDPNRTGDGRPYNNNTKFQYGIDVTYSWKGDFNPYAEGSNGINWSMDTSHSTFYYHDGISWKTSTKSATATNTAEGREKIVTLKNTIYQYYPTTLTYKSDDEIKGITTASNEYKTLFEQKYWLASNGLYPGDSGSRVNFGIFHVDDTHVSWRRTFCSNNWVNNLGTLDSRCPTNSYPITRCKDQDRCNT